MSQTDLPVIFTAFANPKGDLTNLIYEQNGIQDALMPLENQGYHIKHLVRTNTDKNSIFNILREYAEKVSIFHFAGHADSTGISLHDVDTFFEPLSKELVNRNKETLLMVFLNGCSTKEHVKILLESGVKAVLATSVKINDRVAADFAINFYKNLAKGDCLKTAYESASNYVNADSKEQRFRYLGEVIRFRDLGTDNTSSDDNDVFPWGLYVNEEDFFKGQFKLKDITNKAYTVFPKTILPFPVPNPYIPRQIFIKTVANELRMTLGIGKSYDLLKEIINKKHIVLLGEAGMGKSTELQWFCHQVNENGNHHLVYKRLSDYREKSYLEDIKASGYNLSDSVILVLDGLDETDIKFAKPAIEKFRNDFPFIKILVSCRSTAYSDTLSNFGEYVLDKLSESEISKYVKETLEDFSQTFLDFWNSRYRWDRFQLINNPFFLIRICQFVREKGNKIPDSMGDIFEYLIDKSLDLRLQSFSNFGFGDSVPLRKSCRNSLEKLAFVMEFKGENLISKEELEKLISDKDEQDFLLAKSSLIEYQNKSWRFAHNNFQEYLAAKLLSKARNFKYIQRTIGAKPNYSRLKWSWSNSLAFLLSLMENENHMKTKIMDWLSKNDLGVLIKIGSIEKDKFSENDRIKIFKLEYDKCKNEDMVVGYQHYYYWEMADFGQTETTFKFLIDELKQAKTTTVKNNALILLKSMNAAFVNTETITDLRKLLFDNIYNFELNTASNRHYAMEALIKLYDDINEEESDLIVKTFFDSNDAYERASSYHLIEKQHLQIRCMKQLISRSSELKDLGWRKDEIILGDEDFRLKRCFENLETEAEIVSFFVNYPVDLDHQLDIRKNSHGLMLGKLNSSSLSTQSKRLIFNTMKMHFLTWLHYNPTPYKGKEDILSFIKNNGFGLEFFKYCVDDKNISVSIIFLDNAGIEYLAEVSRQGTIKREWLASYQNWVFNQKPEIINLFNQQINEAINEPLPLPEPKPDPANIEDKRIKNLFKEKQLYIYKDKFIEVIKDIFVYFGKEKYERKELFTLSIKERYRTSLSTPIFISDQLMQFITDRSNLAKNELIEQINKNWTWISIDQLKKFLIRYAQEIANHPDLDLNEDEILLVKNWCDKHMNKMILDEQISDRDIAFAWYVIKYKFNHYPKATYQKMVASSLQNHLESGIIAFVLEQSIMTLKELSEFILKKIKSKNYSTSMIYTYLRFIESYQIHEAFPTLKTLIASDNEDTDLLNFALTVYIALKGDAHFLFDLFKSIDPNSNDRREITLLQHFDKKPGSEYQKILQNKLSSSTNLEKQLDYARHLFRLGNLIGLQFLTNFIEKEHRSPFEMDALLNGYNFEFPKGIPYFLKFIDLSHKINVSKSDDTFNSLSSVGRGMLTQLATCKNGIYFKKVSNAINFRIKVHGILNNLPLILKKNLKLFSPESLKDMRYLLKSLEFQYYQKQEVTIEEALVQYRKIV
jgi:hypothetical protein